MKAKIKIFIYKLNVAVCAVGTYVMAFLASDFIKRDLPHDFVSAGGLILCNVMVLYLFVEAGFDLHKVLDEDEEDTDEPTITAEGFKEDFFEVYFGDSKSRAG